MKRLTAAHAAGDLRVLLCIEMEWRGEESSNLASATDAKLKVYYFVLKEHDRRGQGADGVPGICAGVCRARPLSPSCTGDIAHPVHIISDLRQEGFRHENMLAVLRAGGKPCQKTITGWADERARSMAAERRIFG